MFTERTPVQPGCGNAGSDCVDGRSQINPRGYMVAVIGDTQTIVSRLTALNETDYLVQDNRVSLGFFHDIGNALKRQKMMQSVGIDSELLNLPSAALGRKTVADL
jgi:hypothetical protein